FPIPPALHRLEASMVLPALLLSTASCLEPPGAESVVCTSPASEHWPTSSPLNQSLLRYRRRASCSPMCILITESFRPSLTSLPLRFTLMFRLVAGWQRCPVRWPVAVAL